MLMTSRVSKHVCSMVSYSTLEIYFERGIERIYVVCFGFYLNNTAVCFIYISRIYRNMLSREQVKKLSLPKRFLHRLSDIIDPSHYHITFFFWTFATFRLTITSIPCLNIYTIVYAVMLYLYEQRTYVLIYMHYIMYQKGLLYPKCNVSQQKSIGTCLLVLAKVFANNFFFYGGGWWRIIFGFLNGSYC